MTSARVLFAKFISLSTGATYSAGIVRFCCRALLGQLHRYGYGPEHMTAHLFLQVAESTLLLIASIFLWRLRRVALTLFLINFAVVVVPAAYFGFISPDSRMRSFQHSLMFLPVLALVLGFEARRVVAAWWRFLVPLLEVPALASCENTRCEERTGSRVIDLQDHGQAQLIENVERFLTIESEANRTGPGLYLDAMDDKVPWLRDIAVHRLTSSTARNAAPDCCLKFQATVKRHLQSDVPNDRQEAVFWLGWVDSVSLNSGKDRPDGLPILPDSVIRDLLSLALQDPNVFLEHSAFQYREKFDLNRTTPAGECFEILPALRRSAHWLTGEHNILPVALPLTYTYGCIPVR